MQINQEKRYLTPYVLGLSEFAANIGELGRFMAKVLKLPQNVQNIMRSFPTAEFMVDKVGQTFSLGPEQIMELTKILKDILLAEIFWGDFPFLVSSKLGVDPNTANQIVKKIADELLAPAIEDIKSMQREKFRDRIAQNRSNQSQQSPQNTNTEQGNVINLRNKNNQ
ncbi:MAG: hypothetical protein HYZ69_00190 [Candidatus Colwellbacteria bacterium]|nr:hypothetical protein [Candidatus Colwellbacteria bacterium]